MSLTVDVQNELSLLVNLALYSYNSLSLLFYSLFPWISLVDAQTKDTPLTDLVSRDKGLRDCISVMHYNVFSNSAEA